MSKKTLLIIIGLLLIIFIVLVTHPLWRSDKKIREDLFNKLPLGTYMEDVVQYVESKEKWEIKWIDYELGFYYSGQKDDPVGGEDRPIGEKSILVYMGNYKLIFQTDVEAYFGFDENSKLIEIWVRRSTDSIWIFK